MITLKLIPSDIYPPAVMEEMIFFIEEEIFGSFVKKYDKKLKFCPKVLLIIERNTSISIKQGIEERIL